MMLLENPRSRSTKGIRVSIDAVLHPTETQNMNRRILFLITLVVFLNACGPSASASVPTPTVTVIPTATLTPSPVPTVVVPTEQVTAPASLPTISRVLIVTFDGLRPDAIAAAEMKNVLTLMQSGAYTLGAQTIMPSVTLPAHASMVVGTCPAKHIVRWNEYVPENGYALGTDLFDLAHQYGLRTVIVTGKEKLRHLTEPGSTDFFGFIDETDRVKDITTLENMAVEQIREGFGVMLMHFPNGDLAGHEYGWMSKQQLRAYRQDDATFGHLLEVMKDNNMYEGTLIIITSDHGGHETTHGTELIADMTIPWIVNGPRIVPGVLETPVYIMDTAATAAFGLGLPLPPEWDGVPVYEAFGMPVDTLQARGCPGVTP